jgi:hypothetical protein
MIVVVPSSFLLAEPVFPGDVVQPLSQIVGFHKLFHIFRVKELRQTVTVQVIGLVFFPNFLFCFLAEISEVFFRKLLVGILSTLPQTFIINLI